MDTAAASASQDATSEFSLTIVFREITEDGEPYVVAECLELPGCVSQGATRQEANDNIGEAVRLCLSVVFEDSIKRVMAQNSQHRSTDLSSSTRMTIDPTPRVRYA